MIENILILLLMTLLLCFATKQLEPIVQEGCGLIRMGKGHSFAFDMQLFAVTLPSDPSTSSATVGKDYLLYINTGTVAAPVWTLIGGQRGASLSQSAEEIDVGHKTSGGWTDTLAGMRSWSIDLDGLILLQDEGIAALRKAFAQGKKVNIKFRYPDDTYQVGWASLTDFSSEAPHDGEATLSGTLSGSGPLSNIAVVVSKAAATDQTFDFDEKAKVKAVTKAGGAAVAAENYVTDYGEITIESTYFATLTVGEHLLYAELTIGGNALIAVVITD